MIVTIDYEPGRGLTFAATGMTVAGVEVPEGSEFLVVRDLGPTLFIPTADPIVRRAIGPRQLLEAATEGDPRFTLIDVVLPPEPLPAERN